MDEEEQAPGGNVAHEVDMGGGGGQALARNCLKCKAKIARNVRTVL